MHLYAAVALPPEVRRDLASLLDSVRITPPGSGSAPGRHRAGAGRLASLVRRREAPPESVPAVGMLAPVVTADLRVHLASFGNLSNADAAELVSVLGEAATQWTPPRLRVSGGVALDWEGDDGAWARLDGDLAALEQIARAIPQVVTRLNLYIDRRRFRPMAQLGTITDDTTVAYLEQLLVDLGRYESDWWLQRTLQLWGLSSGGTPERFRLFAEIPIGPA